MSQLLGGPFCAGRRRVTSGDSAAVISKDGNEIRRWFGHAMWSFWSSCRSLKINKKFKNPGTDRLHG